MSHLRRLDRRSFLQTTGIALAAGGLHAAVARAGADESARPYKKAVKWGMVQTDGSILDKFKLLKQLGFDGVELDAPSSLNKDEVIQARDETGLPVHGVVDSVHWRDTLSHPDEAVRAAGVKALEEALRDAKFYGGTTVLLVPAVVNKQVSYADAYTRSQAEIKKVLPLAAELEIKIGLENVWNNFLLSPLETARYIDELESPQVGAYFDVGNVLRYGWPEHWIRILGPRILKLDVKEYSRKKQEEEGLWKGFEVELLEGDCDWPAVMAALRDIGFEGWGTAEIPGGGPDRLRDIAARMDRIFAS
ncbi:MAG: sugar phosphate isomerase/epimerase family protein [Pirellulales bacterium]